MKDMPMYNANRPASKAEMIWNEAQMFARELIDRRWLGTNWSDLPRDVREQFCALISEDVPHPGTA